MEQSLASSSATFEPVPGVQVPATFAHHAQQLRLEGGRGTVVTILEYVPLSLLIGLCVLASEEIRDERITAGLLWCTRFYSPVFSWRAAQRAWRASGLARV
jgi:hypothetical protein